VAGRDLHAFVDGELDGEGYRAVVARLAADPDAAERVGDLLRQRGALLALREQLDDVDPLQDERTAALARGLADAVRRRRRVRRGLASSGLALTLAVGLWGVSRYLPPVLALLPVVIGAAFLIERRLSARQVAVGLQPAAAILLRHLPPAPRVIR
jgi:anti-sigma factor RsiW